MKAAPLWIALHALGARLATLDAAVRARGDAEAFVRDASAAVLLDVARAVLSLEAVLRAAVDATGEGRADGAHQWARDGLEAIARSGQPVAAGFALGRVIDALALTAPPGIADRLRSALPLGDLEPLIEEAVRAREREAFGQFGPLPRREPDEAGDRVRAAAANIIAAGRGLE